MTLISAMSPCKLTLLFFKLTAVRMARTSAYIRRTQPLRTREGEREEQMHPQWKIHVKYTWEFTAVFLPLIWHLKIFQIENLKKSELKNKIHQAYPLVWEVLSVQAMSLTSWGPPGTSPQTPGHLPNPRLLAWPACGNSHIELQGDCCNYVLPFHLPCRTPSENVENKLMICHASLMTTVLCAS